MKEQWMKDMQDRFADFEQPAPEGLLDDIQHEMKRRGLVPVDKAGETKHRQLLPLWLKGAAAAVAVAIAVGTGTLLLTDDETLQVPMAQQQMQETQTTSTYIEKPKDVIVEAKKSVPTTKQQSTHRQVTKAMPSVVAVAENDLTTKLLTEDVVGTEQTEIELPQAVIESVVQETKQQDEEQVTEVEVGNQPTSPTVSHKSSNARHSTFQSKRSKSGNSHWQIGTNVSGIQGLGTPKYDYLAKIYKLSKGDMVFFDATANSNKINYDHDHAYVPIGISDGYVSGGEGNGATSNSSYSGTIQPWNNNQGIAANDHHSSNYIPTRGSNNNSSDVVINNQQMRLAVDAHHRQPVKVGLSVRYHFNDRWSVQTGVDYSYHSSDIIRDINNSQIQSEQKLHFVGVPVALSYTLWNPGRFNIYMSAGGEVEKVVKGKQTILRVASNIADRIEQEDVAEKPWQLSIGGSAGVQFSITKLLSLYAEPGVAYYFDNKSELPTIYQEKPFNFNINMGLRFNVGN